MFLRVGEDSHAFEFCVLDEAEKGFELGIGLAREAGDEGGADGEAGDACAEAGDEVAYMGFGSFPAHIFEHSFLDVLQWHIDIAGNFWEASDGGDKFVRPVGGVGVEEADPEIAFDGGKSLEKVDDVFPAL